jgi:hypothetical protein
MDILEEMSSDTRMQQWNKEQMYNPEATSEEGGDSWQQHQWMMQKTGTTSGKQVDII